MTRFGNFSLQLDDEFAGRFREPAVRAAELSYGRVVDDPVAGYVGVARRKPQAVRICVTLMSGPSNQKLPVRILDFRYL